MEHQDKGSAQSEAYAFWQTRAEQALKGRDWDQTLVRSTKDGIERGPVFTRTTPSKEQEHAPLPAARISHTRDSYRPWCLRQSVDHEDPREANRAWREDLQGGVSSALIRLDPEGKHGVQVKDLEGFHHLFTGVDLTLAPAILSPHSMPLFYAELYRSYLEEKGYDLSTLKAGFGLCPVGDILKTGRDDHKTLDEVLSFSLWCSNTMPNAQALRVDAALIAERGGTEAQELAYALATLLFYLRNLDKKGMGITTAGQSLEVCLSADADVHLTLAKLRAARQVFTSLMVACGTDIKTHNLSLTGRSSRAMLTRRGVWNNLMRLTLAGFASVAGGASAITLEPLTEPLGPSTALSRRLSRNLHLLLLHEAHAAVVTDPAGGSFLHEHLTQKLAEKAWTIFQDIERHGGMTEALRTGWWQAQLAHKRDQHLKRLARRDSLMTGVNIHPVFEEQPPQTGSQTPERTSVHKDNQQDSKPSFPVLHPVRWSEAYEALRDRTDAFLKEKGRRPLIALLLRPGDQPEDWHKKARDLFALAGCETECREVSETRGGAENPPHLLCCLSSEERGFSLKPDDTPPHFAHLPVCFYSMAEEGLSQGKALIGYEKGDAPAFLNQVLDLIFSSETRGGA